MSKKILSVIIIISLYAADPGPLSLWVRAGGDNLRPAATADNKGPGGSLSQLESQLLTAALAHYPPALWKDFLRARHHFLDERQVKLIADTINSRLAESKEFDYPIPKPRLRYLFRRLQAIRAAYMKKSDRMNIVEWMEFYFINKMMWNRITFFHGEKRGRFDMPAVAISRAFGFAFEGIPSEEIKIILTNRGKMIYFAEGSAHAIVVDVGGNYFRVLDTTLQPSCAEDGTPCYVCPYTKVEYKGPWLDKKFNRIPLRDRLKKNGRPDFYLISDTSYAEMTHFRMEGKAPFPIECFPGEGTLTLSKAHGILKNRMGIDYVKVCYGSELHRKGLLKAGDWYIEISTRGRLSARFYITAKNFSFIQHFHSFRGNVLRGVKLDNAGMPVHRRAQHNTGSIDTSAILEKTAATHTAISASA